MSLLTAERTGTPAELLAPPDPPPTAALAMLVRPTRRALVLGSAQDPSVVADLEACAAAGLEVVRRRSGGGAVLVGPTDQVWLDAFVPADDPRHDPDVSRAAWWLGEVWVAALADAGMPGARVHRGPMLADRLGRTACFAGIGPGEVTLAGRKLVGISQRRDRRGAWLFTMAIAPPQPGRPHLPELLRLDAASRDDLSRRLDAATTALSAPAADVEAALLARLDL